MAARRRLWLDVAIATALALGSLLFLVLLARVTGPSVSELTQLSATRALGSWFDQAGTVSLWDKVARDRALGPFYASVQLPTLVSAVAWQQWSREHHWLSELITLRLGWIVISSLAAPLVFALGKNTFGRRMAVLSALLMLLVPRAMHQLVLAEPQGAVMACWLAVLVCYAKAFRSPGWGWTLLTGAVFGLALSVSLSTALLLLVLVVHALWMKRSELKASLRQGEFPLPTAAFSMGIVGTGLFVVLTPFLWSHTGEHLRKLVLGAMSSPAAAPLRGAALAAGAAGTSKAEALLSVLGSVPLTTWVLTVIGLGWLTRQALSRKQESASEPTDTDPVLKSLLIVGLITALLWPTLAPESLRSTPARWTLALPFVGMLAGLGFESARSWVRQKASKRFETKLTLVTALFTGLVLLIPAIGLMRSPSTLSVAYSLAFGGAHFAKLQAAPQEDGSAASLLAKKIDAMGRPSVSVHSPAISQELWEAQRQAGVLRTQVRQVPQPRGAELLVTRAGQADQALLRTVTAELGHAPALLQEVKRDGAVLYRLYQLR